MLRVARSPEQDRTGKELTRTGLSRRQAGHAGSTGQRSVIRDPRDPTRSDERTEDANATRQRTCATGPDSWHAFRETLGYCLEVKS